MAQGSIRELLGRAKAFRDVVNRMTWGGRYVAEGDPLLSDERLRSTRLLIIGHSFGGLIVFTALAQYMTDRAAATATAVELGRTSVGRHGITSLAT